MTGRQADRRLDASIQKMRRNETVAKATAAARSERVGTKQDADHENVKGKGKKNEGIKTQDLEHPLHSISDPAAPDHQSYTGAQKCRSSSSTGKIRQDSGQEQRQ